MKSIARLLLLFFIISAFLPSIPLFSHAPLDTWVNSSDGISGGIIRCVVNNHENRSTWYAGSAMHGFFKSIDNGEHWVPSSKGLNTNSINTICISKKDAKQILIGVPQGVYKSTDGGLNWLTINDSIGYVYDILEIINTRMSNYYAASNKGLFRSWDNGDSFKPITDNAVMDRPFNAIICVPTRPEILYANAIFNGPFISMDSGSSWKNINKGLPEGKSLGLFTHPTDDKKVYSIYPGEGLFEFTFDQNQIKEGLYSWKKVNTNFNFLDFTSFSIQVPYYGIQKEDIKCFICTEKHGLYVSKEATLFEQWENKGLPEEWQKVNSIGLSKFKKELLMFGLDGRGIIKTEDQGLKWTQNNSGLLANSITDFIIDLSDKNTFYVTSYSSVFISNNKGETWHYSYKGLPNANITSIIQNPSNQSHFMVSTKNDTKLNTTGDGLYETFDNMKTWKKVTSFSYKNVSCLAINKQSGLIYAGTDGNGLFQSSNYGNSWIKITTDKMMDRITVIRIDPIDDDIIYLGTTINGIYKTSDQCKTWEHIYYVLGRDVFINDIRISPKDSQLIYAGINIITDGGIIRSTNGGKDWTTVNEKRSGTLFTSIYNLPEDNDVIYCGTSNGVLYTKTFGKIWRPINNGLENLKFDGLYFFSIPKLLLDQEKRDILYIATEMGFFRCQISELITDKKPPEFDFQTPDKNPYYVNNDKIVFKGRAVDPQGIEKIVVSENELPFKDDGSFVYSYKMGLFKEKIVFTATDKAENSSSFEFDLFFDEKKPILVIEKPRSFEVLQTRETLIKGYAMDMDSGIEYLDIQGNSLPGSKIDENGNFEYLLTNLRIGDNQIKIIAFDKAKNSEEVSISVKVEGKDELPPVIEISKPTKNKSYYNKSPITIEGKITDDMPIDGLSFYINDIKLSLISDGSFNTQQPLSEGENVFYLKASDLAGNESKKELSIVLDSIKPSIRLIQNTKASDVLFTDQYSLQFEASDEVSGISTVILSDQEGNTLQIEENGSQYQASLPLQKGVNLFTITAIDNAGNETKQNIQLRYQPAVVITLTIGNSVATVQKNKDIRDIVMKVPPMIVKGTTFVPIRFIAETFGARVEWIPHPTNEIQIYFKDILIHLWINKTIGVVERGTETKKVTLLAAPFITNSTTMVPLRFISENLDAQVVWDAPTSTITIIQAVE